MPVSYTHLDVYKRQGFTTRIVDVSEKESEALLGFLFAHITKPEFQVRWRWQPDVYKRQDRY